MAKDLPPGDDTPTLEDVEELDQDHQEFLHTKTSTHIVRTRKSSSFYELKHLLPAFSWPSFSGALAFFLKTIFYGVIWLLIGQVEYRGERIGTHIHQSISSPKMQSALSPISTPINFVLAAIGFPTEGTSTKETSEATGVKKSLEKFKEAQKQRRSVLEELERQNNSH